MKPLLIAMLAGLSAITAIDGSAKADGTIGIAVVAPITSLTLGVGAGLMVVGHELLQPRPFGPNGEGMRAGRAILKAPGGLVHQWFPHW